MMDLSRALSLSSLFILTVSDAVDGILLLIELGALAGCVGLSPVRSFLLVVVAVVVFVVGSGERSIFLGEGECYEEF